MEFKFNDGREVEVRRLKPNEDVFALMKFINTLMDEDNFLTLEKKITPEEETGWLQGQCKKIAEGTLIDLRAVDGDKIIGGCQAEKGMGKEDKCVLLGIALSKEYRSQGLVTAMMKELMRQVQEEWSPQAIYLYYYGGNKLAKMLYESLGFKEVGRIPKCLRYKDCYVDRVYMVWGDSPCLK